MSESRKGKDNSFFGKSHSDETRAKLREIALNREKDHKPSLTVEVLDLTDHSTSVYSSVREAALKLGTNVSTLISRDKRGTIKPYRGRYVISIKS